VHLKSLIFSKIESVPYNAVRSVSNPSLPEPDTWILAIFYSPKPVFFLTTKPGYFKNPGIAVASKY